MRAILIALLLLSAFTVSAQVESSFYFSDGNGNVVHSDSTISISVYDKNTFDNYSVIQYSNADINILLCYIMKADSIFNTKPVKSILLGKIDNITYWYFPTKSHYQIKLRILEGKKYIARYYTTDILLPLLTTARDIYIDTSRQYYDELSYYGNALIDSLFKQIQAVH